MLKRRAESTTRLCEEGRQQHTNFTELHKDKKLHTTLMEPAEQRCHKNTDRFQAPPQQNSSAGVAFHCVQLFGFAKVRLFFGETNRSE